MIIMEPDRQLPRENGTTHCVGVSPDWGLVGLLWVAFFLNQADRQVFNVVLPLIQADLNLSNQAVGAIATVFTIALGVLVPVAGLAGDLFDRRRIVVFSLVLFSLGTLATGFASGMVALILLRGVATGGGEAFYAPAAASLISETHDRTRARALSIHQTANYSGIVLGSLLSGWIAENYGWRSTFLVYGVAGLAWAAIFHWRTGRGERQHAPRATRVRVDLAPFGEAIRLIASRPALIVQLVAFGAMVFGTVGFLTWTPTLLRERFGYGITAAGFHAVLWHYLAAYIGVLTAGVLTDRWVARWPRIRLLTMGLGLVVCAPWVLLVATAATPLVMFIGLAGFGLARGVYDANLFAAIIDIVEDRLRSTVLGLLIASGFILGAIAPWAMGAMKDHYGLAGGFVLIASVFLAAGALLLTTIAAGRSRAR
ncbi:MFS transporter [Sphingomonas aliaeris]|uniref:MFS transporter n=2 Tax=Sphingomonas aliaeris TaxID=2759526 RepID=A0A974S4J8_9SPHN|nr:MFS transporter [Sphingomonas aliaeris]